MRVKVRLFASLREAAGRDVVELELAEGATVADAWIGLCTLDEAFGACRHRVLIARNRRYVRADAPLADGDELALFPPLSGGH
jgi:MoaE-MoaD fusion protein